MTIFDDVCHDRSMRPRRRAIGTLVTIGLETVCPLDGDTLDDNRDCPTCPPEMRGAARRVIEIRRAALEPAVVVTYGAHRQPADWPQIRLTPLVEGTS